MIQGTNWRNRAIVVAVAAVCATLGGGCRTGQPQSASTAPLFAPAGTGDRPAKLAPQPTAEDQPEPKYTSDLPPVQPPTPDRTTTPLVAGPTDAASTAADAAPASASLPPTAEPKAEGTRAMTQPAPSATPTGSGFMVVGGIVARVNGSPIYAQSVFAHLDRELQAQARQLDADEFKAHAAQAIAREEQELVHDEALFLEADKALSEDERRIVDGAVMQERDRRVKEAGGSAETAKRRAVDEDGFELDELMRDRQRRLTVEMLYVKHIWPLVSVSAADMRTFYDANADKLYTRKAAARYRVIELRVDRQVAADPRATAKAKADLVRAKAVRGDDFAALASAENDDGYLRRHAGDPNASSEPGKPGEAVGPNAFRVEAVDQALWALPAAGQVTDVIESDGAFYVAKLEERATAETKPFDDAGVQDDVTKRLEAAQRQMYQDRFEQASRDYVVASVPVDGMPMMIEMAMQKYAKWSRR